MAGRDDDSRGSGASTAIRLFGEYHPHTYTRTAFRLGLRRLPCVLVLCFLPMCAPRPHPNLCLCFPGQSSCLV